ncbi:MAG: hypothetical protein Tsb0033_27830 [Winogradskyella sp.]
MNCGTNNLKGTGLGNCAPNIGLHQLLEKRVTDIWKSQTEFLNRTDLNHKIRTISQRIKDQSLRQLY